jgi:hypothetical protein
MDFIIPERLLKQDEWNHIQIEYINGLTHFGLKINRSYDDRPTMIPIFDLANDKEFKIKLDTRTIVEK